MKPLKLVPVSDHHSGHHSEGTPRSTGAVDPVCGMTVDPARAAGEYDYKGTTYYFCNPSCLAKFKANPEKFLTPAEEPEKPAPAGTIYTCPMHPEIIRNGPGA